MIIANKLFMGVDKVASEDAADVNDDGSVDVSDPVALLNAVYLGSGQIAAPAGYCGADMTPDTLSCRFRGCGALDLRIIDELERSGIVCVTSPCPIWRSGGELFDSVDTRNLNLSTTELLNELAQGVRFQGFVVEDPKRGRGLVVWQHHVRLRRIPITR